MKKPRSIIPILIVAASFISTSSAGHQIQRSRRSSVLQNIITNYFGIDPFFAAKDQEDGKAASQQVNTRGVRQATRNLEPARGPVKGIPGHGHQQVYAVQRNGLPQNNVNMGEDLRPRIDKRQLEATNSEEMSQMAEKKYRVPAPLLVSGVRAMKTNEKVPAPLLARNTLKKKSPEMSMPSRPNRGHPSNLHEAQKFSQLIGPKQNDAERKVKGLVLDDNGAVFESEKSYFPDYHVSNGAQRTGFQLKDDPVYNFPGDGKSKEGEGVPFVERVSAPGISFKDEKELNALVNKYKEVYTHPTQENRFKNSKAVKIDNGFYDDFQAEVLNNIHQSIDIPKLSIEDRRTRDPYFRTSAQQKYHEYSKKRYQFSPKPQEAFQESPVFGNLLPENPPIYAEPLRYMNPLDKHHSHQDVEIFHKIAMVRPEPRAGFFESDRKIEAMEFDPPVQPDFQDDFNAGYAKLTDSSHPAVDAPPARIEMLPEPMRRLSETPAPKPQPRLPEPPKPIRILLKPDMTPSPVMKDRKSFLEAAKVPPEARFNQFKENQERMLIEHPPVNRIDDHHQERPKADFVRGHDMPGYPADSRADDHHREDKMEDFQMTKSGFKSPEADANSARVDQVHPETARMSDIPTTPGDDYYNDLDLYGHYDTMGDYDYNIDRDDYQNYNDVEYFSDNEHAKLDPQHWDDYNDLNNYKVRTPSVPEYPSGPSGDTGAAYRAFPHEQAVEPPQESSRVPADSGRVPELPPPLPPPQEMIKMQHDSIFAEPFDVPKLGVDMEYTPPELLYNQLFQEDKNDQTAGYQSKPESPYDEPTLPRYDSDPFYEPYIDNYNREQRQSGLGDVQARPAGPTLREDSVYSASTPNPNSQRFEPQRGVHRHPVAAVHGHAYDSPPSLTLPNASFDDRRGYSAPIQPDRLSQGDSGFAPDLGRSQQTQPVVRPQSASYPSISNRDANEGYAFAPAPVKQRPPPVYVPEGTPAPYLRQPVNPEYANNVHSNDYQARVQPNSLSKDPSFHSDSSFHSNKRPKLTFESAEVNFTPEDNSLSFPYNNKVQPEGRSLSDSDPTNINRFDDFGQDPENSRYKRFQTFDSPGFSHDPFHFEPLKESVAGQAHHGWSHGFPESGNHDLFSHSTPVQVVPAPPQFREQHLAEPVHHQPPPHHPSAPIQAYNNVANLDVVHNSNQFVNVEAPDVWESGHLRGHPVHSKQEYTRREGRMFKQQTSWVDTEGGYGKHYFEFNH